MHQELIFSLIFCCRSYAQVPKFELSTSLLSVTVSISLVALFMSDSFLTESYLTCQSVTKECAFDTCNMCMIPLCCFN